MKLSHLSDEELLKRYKQNLPHYRRLLSKLTSLLSAFLGKVFSAFAGDTTIDVSGTDDIGKGNALHVTGFKAPPVRRLRQYLEALDLNETLDELKETYERLKRSPVPELKAEAVNVHRTYVKMVELYNQALDHMTDIANKHIPDSIGEVFKQAEKAIAKIKDDFGESEDPEIFIFVGVDENKGIQFTQQIDISHWDHGNEGGTMTLVVTAQMSPEANGAYDTRVYVNTHARAVIPFRYDVGQEIVGNSVAAIGKKMKEIFEETLAVHNVVSVLAPAELKKVDPTELSSILMSIKGVADVNVFEDSIELELESHSGDTISKVVRALNSYRPLKAMIGKGFNPSFRNIGGNSYIYTLARKAGDDKELRDQRKIEKEIEERVRKELQERYEIERSIEKSKHERAIKEAEDRVRTQVEEEMKEKQRLAARKAANP